MEPLQVLWTALYIDVPLKLTEAHFSSVEYLVLGCLVQISIDQGRLHVKLYYVHNK